jgi:hypothetical protein
VLLLLMPRWLAPSRANLPQIDQSQKIAISVRGSLISAQIRAILCARGALFSRQSWLRRPRNRLPPAPSGTVKVRIARVPRPGRTSSVCPDNGDPGGSTRRARGNGRGTDGETEKLAETAPRAVRRFAPIFVPPLKPARLAKDASRGFAVGYCLSSLRDWRSASGRRRGRKGVGCCISLSKDKSQL